MDNTAQATRFLARHHMAPCPSQALPQACLDLQREMVRGLEGEPSSLMMLPAYLSLDRPLPDSGRAVALDMGGTNFRAALGEWSGGTLRFGPQALSPTPGSQGPVSREQFLDAVAQSLGQYPAGCPVGFCFSFPARITPELDGEVLCFDKEVRVAGGAGLRLIRDLSAHMVRRGMTPPAAGAVINDTVAALLGGYLTADRQGHDGFAGFVLGTGLNCCYAQPGWDGGGDMVVNLEAGGYDGFPQGDYDRALDAASRDPGTHRLEKMTSGAYLGPLMERTLKGAAREGLFSPRCAGAVLALEGLELAQVSAWLDGTDADALARRLQAEADDRAALTALLTGLVERAARQVAVLLTAVLLQGDMGRDARRPAAIVAEGSTFHKFRGYRQRIEGHLDRLCTGRFGRHWRFIQVQDADLAGAAAAVLLGPAGGKRREGAR